MGEENDDVDHVVTAFLRNRGELLLLRRSDAVGTYAGQWGGVSGFAEGDPEAAVRWEIEEETGFVADPADPDADVERIRTGTPVRFSDEELGRTWIVHPSLFDCARRDVHLSDEHTTFEWLPATELLRRECVPELWTAYERVSPTVRSVTADDQHGSAYISVRALEVLRDRAGLIVAEAAAEAAEAAAKSEARDVADHEVPETGVPAPDGATEEGGEGWEELADLARRLRRARPGMTALYNRVNRAMATADRTPAAVEAAATDGIERAIRADEDAAGAAAAHVADRRVLTLSRSGTVVEALSRAAPSALFVAESRPAREGVGVAEAFADECPVTVHTDAAIAHVCAEAEIDVVLVGADTVLPDGGVINKTGTRVAGLAAAREGVTFYAVTASDKITTDDTVRLEAGEGSAVYDGDAPIEVRNPSFDVTPPDLVDGIVTEGGTLTATEVAAVAERFRDYAAWDRPDVGAAKSEEAGESRRNE